MRRRLYWTITGVAILSGLLVLLGALIATRRVAEDANRRELARSSREVVVIIGETFDTTSRPRAVFEFLRLLEGDLGPLFNRVQRAAGGSTLAFGAINPSGALVSNHPLFDRIEANPEDLVSEKSTFYSSDEDGLVAVTPTSVDGPSGTVTLVVALARATPVVRIADFGWAWLVIASGIAIVAAALARVLSTQLAAKLTPLSEASRSLAAGELSVRVPSMGDPDLDGVGEAFNEMAAEIEATREREREFLLGVGHDLRTPLTTIGGYAEALEAEALDAGEVARIGEVLGVQSRQLGRLIEDLTLLARLQQPEFSLRIEEVEVGSHISEVVRGFEISATEAGVKFDADIEDGLRVRTDPDRLAQIAQNLIENALRYTPEAGRVTVTVSRQEGAVVLSVEDTGVGIDPDDLPHIFERHFVGSTRQVRNKGTGLGLSIVKGLSDRLGARVTAQSTLGKGTQVTVLLPN